jgi:CRP-like cAMP-binding protein
MPAPKLKNLRAQASMAMRNCDYEDALAAYCELEVHEPDNPTWPQRKAEIFEQQEIPDQAVAQFEHALAKAIDATHVMVAISICKQILSLAPDHRDALDQLHAMTGESAPALMPELPEELCFEDEPHDAPLEEMLLTVVVPDASPHPSLHLDNSGIIEIPLTQVAPPAVEQAIKPISPSGVGGQLGDTPLFGSLGPKTLRALIKRSEIVSLEEDEVLFRQGDLADALYVVIDGAVVPIAEEGAPKKLAILEAGAFFGEIGLITDCPRNASIQAIVETRLLKVGRKAIRETIKQHPEMLDVLLCFLRDRLVDRLIRTHSLFETFPARQRPSVAKLFGFLEVHSGSTIVQQGCSSESLYALLAGTAQVIQMDIDSDKVLAELSPGTIVGEMSVLNETPAIASVVATSKCWFLALSRKNLLRLTENNPRAEAVIRRMADTRESQNAGRKRTPLGQGSNGGFIL